MGGNLKRLDLNNIRITDKLFGAYVERVSEKIIPHQWNILNDRLDDTDPTYCIENFRIAAKEAEGERKGVVFRDSDLHKWLEAVAFSLAGGQGKEYEPLADEVIELIGRAQEEDGYLNTYFTLTAPDKKWTNLIEGHELYTAGHFIEAAVAYYEATKKEAILDIAKKNADLICKVFGRGEGQIQGYPGHQEIELALIKLYRVTGNKTYLETAKYFIDERGKEPNYLVGEMERRNFVPEFFPEFKGYDLEYSQAHKRPVDQDTVEGHSVRAMYMCAAMADLAEEYEDEEMLEACKRLWDNMVNQRMYITGGIGSSGFRERFTTDYDLPNATNYSETCASVGIMMFGQRMASATGEAKYYDDVERALYNTVLSGTNIEGDRYFYVNPLEVVPEFCTEHTYMDHVKAVRQRWFDVPCCPTNVARTLASLGQYIYAKDENSLYIHQFISSEAKDVVAGNEMEVKMDSELLQTGKVTVDIKSSGNGNVKVRVPHYAEDWKVTVNGAECAKEVMNGYITLNVAEGDNHIEIDWDVKAKWVAANDKVREDAGKAALVKGPMVYCLEEIDNGDLLSQIYVEANAAVEADAPVQELVGEVPTLNYKGIRVKNAGVQNALYGAVKIEKEDVTLKAVPYCMWNNRGCGEMLVWHKVRI